MQLNSKEDIFAKLNFWPSDHFHFLHMPQERLCYSRYFEAKHYHSVDAQWNLSGIGKTYVKISSEMSLSLLNGVCIFDVRQLKSKYQIWGDNTLGILMEKDI